jgi:hypothetical protein
MNAASVALEKRALLVARFAETHLVARPVHIFRFERCRAHASESSGAFQIVLGQINVALLIAAIGAAGLASEANRIHLTIMILRGAWARLFRGFQIADPEMQRGFEHRGARCRSTCHWLQTSSSLPTRAEFVPMEYCRQRQLDAVRGRG